MRPTCTGKRDLELLRLRVGDRADLEGGGAVPSHVITTTVEAFELEAEAEEGDAETGLLLASSGSAHSEGGEVRAESGGRGGRGGASSASAAEDVLHAQLDLALSNDIAMEGWMRLKGAGARHANDNSPPPPLGQCARLATHCLTPTVVNNEHEFERFHEEYALQLFS